MENISNINGVLVVNKPSGMTSRDVVNKLSKILGTKKIGHTGTLDPMAEGVLVCTIGKCTKLSLFLTSENKSYKAEMILGYETDTLDTTGTTLLTSSKSVSNEDITKTIKSFIGTYIEEVPIYSAVKVNGKKLYEYARNNIEVTLPKKEVQINDINSIEINYPKVTFICNVSKGTYIRSLIRDIGRSLNTYASMSALERTSQGKYTLDDAYTLEDIEKGEYHILSIEEVLSDVPSIETDEILYKKVSNGVELELSNKDEYILFKSNGELTALYKKDKNKFRMYVKF
jgi:tRNA pseudouridine55 synthase